MNEHTRKISLRLQGYDYSRPGTYFITICAKDNEMMFGEITSSHMALSEYGSIVQTILERTNQAYRTLLLETFIVMPNHIHMLIYITDPGDQLRRNTDGRPYSAIMPTFVRTLKTLTTKALGFSLWQRSYYDNIVHDDTEREIIRQYIKNNPTTWEKDRFYSAH